MTYVEEEELFLLQKTGFVLFCWWISSISSTVSMVVFQVKEHRVPLCGKLALCNRVRLSRYLNVWNTHLSTHTMVLH